MPKPGTQLNGKVSRRGRQSEGGPTKQTPELVARLTHFIALGLNDAEASAACGISEFTLINWRHHPEFLQQVKNAVAPGSLSGLNA